MTAQYDRILIATAGEPIWTQEPDEHGNQRHRAAEEAAKHLANMPAERRAELERQWSDHNG